MIGYLRSVYPGTHVTLHAGELTPDLVRDPADITFHIRQAVEIAGAERIGHGVSLVHETGYPARCARWRRHVLVEAPLTSNAQILGVSGLAHPFWRYRAAGVPLALATDDPGVSRIDITHEYAFATTQYGLRYPTCASSRARRSSTRSAGAQPVAVTGRLHPRGCRPARHPGVQASEPAVRKAAAHEPQGERAVEARDAAARVRTQHRPLALRGCAQGGHERADHAEPQVAPAWTGVRPGRRPPAPPLA